VERSCPECGLELEDVDLLTARLLRRERGSTTRLRAHVQEFLRR
jgi:hypothetical protein